MNLNSTIHHFFPNHQYPSTVWSHRFRTFDQYWNEEYDNIQDTQQRLKAVIDVTKELTKLSTASWLQMYKDMRPILEHNYKVLMETQWLPPLDSVL